MMNIRPIKTRHDHNQALQRIASLMDAEADTKDGEELDVLVTKALEPYLGGRNRVSEVLSGKRRLSMRQIRKLHDGLNIPFENLIGAD